MKAKQKINVNNISATPDAVYEMTALAELTPNPRNARTHSKSPQRANSLKEFRFVNPVIVDKKGNIIAGHGRFMAAQKLGLSEIPTLNVKHLTASQQRAYMLADNRMALDAGWDEDLLSIELKELKEMDFDLSLTGFDDSELDGFLNSESGGATDEDDIPEAPAHITSAEGDVWLLDKHRVICGDSTNPGTVTAVLNGAQPHLMVTDPPYGVEYDANWRNHTGKPGRTGRATGKVLNDGRADWRQAWALFPGDVAYIWHAGKFAGVVEDSLKACDFEMRSQIIWKKNNIAISRGDYHWQHEPCWYAVRAGKKGHWNGDRKQTTVWDIDKPMKSETRHSTQKPVECMRRPIINNSKKDDVVYDPFLGSGTTLIAAETEKRVCYGIELNPAYVDIIVKRWQEFTGKEAVLESSGETFAEVELGRQTKKVPEE